MRRVRGRRQAGAATGVSGWISDSVSLTSANHILLAGCSGDVFAPGPVRGEAIDQRGGGSDRHILCVRRKQLGRGGRCTG